MKIRIALGIAGAWLATIAIMISLQNRGQAIPWYERYPVICHALGVTQEGETLTNSKEAFLYNYERGQRVFEADFQVTSDGVMVLRHDWNSDLGQADAFGWTDEKQWAVTAKDFLETPIYGKYTPLTLEDWFAIMKEYPDIYLVTDTKYSSDVEGQFKLFTDTAVENGYKDVLSRVIIQIYYKEMYDEVSAVYPFKNWIWTLYYIGYPDKQEIVDFMTQKEISVLVMPYTWWDSQKEEDLKDSSIRVYVHTVNDEEESRKRISQGVNGIYSDNILSEVFKEWQESFSE